MHVFFSYHHTTKSITILNGKKHIDNFPIGNTEPLTQSMEMPKL